MEMERAAIRAIKEAIIKYGLSRRELLSILSIIEVDVWKKRDRDAKSKKTST